MPTESQLNNLTTKPTAASAIENEIPAYRAIAPGAIFASLLGVLAILSFVSWYFLAFAVLAILVGFVTDRKIQRMSDVLTGRGLAQAGMGLGLIFGLAAISVITVQNAIRVSQAKSFARTYEEALRKGTFDLLVWYGHAGTIRDENTPEALVKELTKPGPGLSRFDEKFAPLREVRKALDEPGAEVHFQTIESHGDQDLVSFAGAVYEIHRPKAEKPGDREQLALTVMKGSKNKTGKLEWWVDEFIFPYVPKSFVGPKPPPKEDDGHGHSH